MTIRNSILILLIPILVNACTERTAKKQYAETIFYTSFDSNAVTAINVGKKFKYRYQEYNADSNLIYEEKYGTPEDYEAVRGKLYEKTRFYYTGKNKNKAEIEYGVNYSSTQRNNGKGKYVDTYVYNNNLLTQWISDGKLKEEYTYNDKQEQDRQILHLSNTPAYYHFIYSNGLKIKTEYFAADTIFLTDTFIYNKNNKLTDTYSYNASKKTVGHRQIVRDEKGNAMEEKWKEPYDGFRTKKDGQFANDEFYQANHYFYDSKGRSVKTEFYDLGILKTVYEFVYD